MPDAKRDQRIVRALMRGHRFAMLGSLAALAAVATVALVLSPRAAAEVVWSEPLSLSAGAEEARSPAVAIDAEGAVTVAWRDRGGGSDRIRARRIAADGSLSAPVRTLRSVSGARTSEPQVAISPDGSATIVWAVEEDGGEGSVVQARRLSAGGALAGATVDLSAEGERATSPRVAVDRAGHATIAWLASEGGEPESGEGGEEGEEGGADETKVAARRMTATGALGPVHVISPADEVATSPAIDADRSGRVTVAWSNEGEGSRAQALRFGAGGSPGPRHDLSDSGTPIEGVEVVVDPAGLATVAWLQGSPSQASVRLRRIAASGSPVGSVEPVSAAGAAGPPSLAVNEAGLVSVAWSQHSAFEPNVQLRLMTRDGSLGRTQKLTVDRADTTDPASAVDDEGRAIVTWTDSSGTGSRIHALRTGPDGTLGPIRRISEGSFGRDGVALVDGDREPTIVWSERSGSTDRVRAARGGLVGPITTLLGEPSQGSVIDNAMPQLDFTAATADSLGTIADFECRIGTGRAFPCMPGEEIGPLANGLQVFGVRAVDIEGDWGPHVARSFRVIATALPAKLTLDRVRLFGARPANRRLAAIGSLDPRAAGEPVFLAYRTRRGVVRARGRVGAQGRFRIVQPVRGRAARARGGRAVIGFTGSRELRGARGAVRVRAGGEISIRLGRVRLHGGRLRLAGRLAPAIGGPVRAQLELNRPNAAPASIRLPVRLNRGRFLRIERRVPAWVSVAGGYVTVSHPGRGKRSGRIAGARLDP